jgi:hypothetical protein
VPLLVPMGRGEPRMDAMRHVMAAEDAEVDSYLRAIEQRSEWVGAPYQALTERFIAVAASFSSRRGIDYGTWIEVGVPVAVLRAAGLCPAHTPERVLVEHARSRRCDRRHYRARS